MLFFKSKISGFIIKNKMSSIHNLPDIRGKYRENVNIGKLCWFKTDAIAEIVFLPADIDDLQHFLKNKPGNLNTYIMGAGSNLLIREHGFKGIMIRLGANFNYTKLRNDSIIAGSGCLDASLAKFAATNNISGLEFYTSIPGTVGGALRMNAGAHGVETKDVLIEALAINTSSGEIRKFSNKDFGFVYRGSALSTEWLFLEAKFAGVLKDSQSILNIMAEIKETRQKTQPIHTKTGGSTFKNPARHKAWQLIDQCGLRGYTYGGAKFSELHCNFLVNYNNAKAQDIEYLINLAKEKVKKKFNIELETEIKILG